MRKLDSPAARILAAAAVALLVCLLAPAAARATTAAQTFVSASGLDSNSSAGCIRSKPCRLIQAALNVTTPGGILTILDSANYGASTVTQSVEIVAAPGAEAIVATFAAGIYIDAPDAVVTIRGLYLTSTGGTQADGIRVNSVAVLHVENCVISGFPGNGISVPLANQNVPAKIYVSDTVARGNHAAGISLDGNDPSNPITAVLEHVRLENNDKGLALSDDTEATLRSSVLSGGSFGIQAAAIVGSQAKLIVEDSEITDNSIGIFSGGGDGSTIVDVAGSTIAFNHTGLLIQPGGFIYSRKDNMLRRNTTNGAFSATFATQ